MTSASSAGRSYRIRAWVKAENVKGDAGWYTHVGQRPEPDASQTPERRSGHLRLEAGDRRVYGARRGQHAPAWERCCVARAPPGSINVRAGMPGAGSARGRGRKARRHHAGTTRGGMRLVFRRRATPITAIALPCGYAISRPRPMAGQALPSMPRCSLPARAAGWPNAWSSDDDGKPLHSHDYRGPAAIGGRRARAQCIKVVMSTGAATARCRMHAAASAGKPLLNNVVPPHFNLVKDADFAHGGARRPIGRAIRCRPAQVSSLPSRSRNDLGAGQAVPEAPGRRPMHRAFGEAGGRRVPVQPGHSYLVSAWIKCSDVALAGKCCMSIRPRPTVAWPRW